MFRNKTRNLSYIFSVTFHLILGLIFFFIHFQPELKEQEFVTIGFGSYGKASPTEVVEKEQPKEPEKEKEEPKQEEQKEVDLPESKSTDEENIIQETEKEKQPPKEEKVKKEPVEAEKEESEEGVGKGKYGFEIDFGGKGTRKIYSYSLPKYPEGVAKEIDVKLRFTILPDGTVGKIFPLIKADTRLENAAINSLRQWRFEPLPEGQKQKVQSAVIVFPYRLQ
jgi:protein TonB